MTNDNEPANGIARAVEPDPHGRAAMLLVESLVHGLVARSVIGLDDAIEIVEIASEVDAEIANDLGDPANASRVSLGLLAALTASLKGDKVLR